MKIGSCLYYIVKWPETQYFMDDRSRTHLAVEKAYDRFGESAFFVKDTYYHEVYGYLHKGRQGAFVKVHFSTAQSVVNACDVEKYPVMQWGDSNSAVGRSYFVEASKLHELIRHFPKHSFTL